MATIVQALRHAVGQLSAGNFAEVQRIGNEVLTHEPGNADALHLLGLAARRQEQHETAIDCFRRAVAVKPNKALYHFELGIALKLTGDVEAALTAYQRAIELDPLLHAAYVNVGASLDDLGRHVEALSWYHRALGIKPDCPCTYGNLGNALQALGRLEESIATYRRALDLDPTTATSHWNFAMALLRSGHFREGWQEYEWRANANETKLDLYPQPAWDGSSLAGKTLLVHAEQGIGDEILFAACYPDLVQQAAHCIFICDPRLESLLARSFPQATVIGYRRKHERTPCEVGRPIDFQIPAGSLPRFLRPDLASFPQRDSYLTADPARVQLWRERFAALGPGLKIGISWRAGGKPSEQVRRTTDLSLWRRLFALPGVHCINLQYGQAAEDLARARARGWTIHDWEDADALTDLEGLAAMLKALDLVISVGNTTVHLAGSLGAPAWSLLAANPSWRWMDEGDRVPWYSSVRLFRQPRGEPWQVVFDRVHQELCPLAGLADAAQLAANDDPEIDFAADDSPEIEMALLRIPAQVSGMKFVAKLTQMVETGVKHHQVGELAQAEALYREVLKNTPQHADALHLLGVVCQQTGRTREALRLLKQAIALCDTIPGFHFHIGLAFKDAGQTEQAIQSYRRAAELKPDFVEAHLNLGAALQERGRYEEAIQCYELALGLGQQVAGIHLNLGAALRALGRWQESRAQLERALEIQPALPEARVQLGLLFQERREWQEAIAQYQQAIEEKPDHAAAFRCLGKAFQEQHRWDEAIVCFQRALELKPRDFDSAANLGVAFEQQEQFSLAVDSFRRALEIHPHAQTQLRLTAPLRHLGRLDEALRECDLLLEREPEHAFAHWTRAQILLQRGDFEQGWEEYRWRWKLPGQCGTSLRDVNHLAERGATLWDGSSLAGRTILVHGEPALNDMLMFAACLPEIVSRAQRTTITCDRQLERLFARTFPEAEIRPIAAETPACDVQVPLSRLPQLLQYSPADFHRHRKPLVADTRQTRQCRELWEQPGAGPRIGLLWRGRHKANIQPGTSRAPALEHWQPLLGASEAQFISLLPNAAPEELASLRGCQRAPIALPHTEDLDELAAQIAALDLVITVDDLSAHLAASLGKEVWLLLPYAWGWQWPLGTETAPWYSCVRLFRPKRLNAWPEMMSRVCQRLAVWLESGPHTGHVAAHRQPNRPHALPSAPGRTTGSMLTM